MPVWDIMVYTLFYDQIKFEWVKRAGRGDRALTDRIAKTLAGPKKLS
jgi:hypothetical protein